MTFRVSKFSSNFQDHGAHELWMFFFAPRMSWLRESILWNEFSNNTSKISIKKPLKYYSVSWNGGGILRRWFLLTAVSQSLRFFQSSPCGLEEHVFPRPALSYELASLILLIELAWTCMKQHKSGQSIRVPVFVFISSFMLIPIYSQDHPSNAKNGNRKALENCQLTQHDTTTGTT